VDSLSGRGIPELKQTLFATCREHAEPDADELPYLPIDRVFSVRGAGTVVTGTLMRGRLAEGVRVALAPRAESWRVRSLNSHHTRVVEIGAGNRVGVNLSGVEVAAVRRGDTLVAADYPYVGRFLNVRLRLLESAPPAWKHGLRVLLYAGCFEVQCRVWGVTRDEGLVWAQVELPRELPFFPGQRFILRNTNPLTTIGGGEVLDLAPDRPRRVTPAERAAYRRRVRGEPWLAAYLAGARDPVLDLAVLARRWMVPGAELGRQAATSAELRTTAGAPRGASTLVWRTELEAELFRRLREFAGRQARNEMVVPYDRLGRELRVRPEHLQPLLGSLMQLDQPESDFLREHARLDRGGLVLYPGAVAFTAEEQELATRVLNRLRVQGLRPSRVRELRVQYADCGGVLDAVLMKLQLDGRAVRINTDFVLHPDAAAQLRAAVAGADMEGGRAADWGRVLNLSRKYSLPYLEYLNREGILRRKGDQHFRTGRAVE
jgi:selenocysteine-specific elongation factor